MKQTRKSGYISTPEALLYYQIQGRGIPFLLLHGNGQSHQIFSSYARRLSRRFQVILMDSRGHGRSRLKSPSGSPGFTVSDMAQDVKALLDQLHIRRAILLGFSDGANIALEFACQFPQRTLAVISASGNALPSGLRRPVWAGSWLLYSLCGFLLQLPFLQWLPSRLRRPLVRRRMLSSLLLTSPSLPASRLRSIRVPVLLLAGTRDLIKTSHTRWMADNIPGSRLVLIPGGTHRVLFGRQRLCLACIVRFLRDC